MDENAFGNLNIEDLPDNWYDIVQSEGFAILERIYQYPLELGIIILQAIMQAFIYAHLKRDFQEGFVRAMSDTFIEQFKAWDEEDTEADSSEEPEC